MSRVHLSEPKMILASGKYREEERAFQSILVGVIT